MSVSAHKADDADLASPSQQIYGKGSRMTDEKLVRLTYIAIVTLSQPRAALVDR
jgi:hypothetical protein